MYSNMPMPLPLIIRQKLAYHLSLSARMHLSRGVPLGPPAYIQECYPKNCFTADRTVVSPKYRQAAYGKFIGLKSVSFAEGSTDDPVEPPVFNAFENSVRIEEKELQEFLYGTTGRGTFRSISSLSSLHPSNYTNASQRRSFSNGIPFRDLAGNLRNTSSRGSRIWGSSFNRNLGNAYALVTYLTTDVWVFYPYSRIRLLSSKGAVNRVCRRCFS